MNKENTIPVAVHWTVKRDKEDILAILSTNRSRKSDVDRVEEIYALLISKERVTDKQKILADDLKDFGNSLVDTEPEGWIAFYMLSDYIDKIFNFKENDGSSFPAGYIYDEGVVNFQPLKSERYYNEEK